MLDQRVYRYMNTIYLCIYLILYFSSGKKSAISIYSIALLVTLLLRHYIVIDQIV